MLFPPLTEALDQQLDEVEVEETRVGKHLGKVHLEEVQRCVQLHG